MKLFELSLFSGLLLSSALAWSATDVIELPQEELARETVLPKFDRPVSVKNRLVSTEQKMEFAATYGWNFTEPIYEQGHYNLMGGYHWSETSGMLLQYTIWGKGRNKTYTDPLAEGNKQLDFSRTPNIQSSIFGYYEWRIFYGKLSLTKMSTMNLHLFPIFGLGMIQYSHKSYYGTQAGLGWKFYFTPTVAIRTDLKLQYAQGPSPFLGGGKLNKTNPTTPDAGEFQDKWGLDTMFDLGVSFLF